VSTEAKRRSTEKHPTPERAPAEIIKALSPITHSGHRPDSIFEDWLTITEATLDTLPAHQKSAATTGRPAEDSADVAATWHRLRAKYGEKSEAFNHFSQAFGLLLQAAFTPDDTPAYRDIIGDTFMQWSHPSRWAGQFFTPWPVARMMAEMVSDHGAEVHTRLQQAITQSPLAGALAVAGIVLEGEEAQQWLLTKVVPAALSHYEPVTVIDPAVGSGIMLLAHASTMPRWMVTMGLVQYYGCDIDPTCVQMARINCKLYGLNGYHLKSALALTAEELAALPKAYAETYTEAQQAQAAGDIKRVEAIARAIHGEQIGLFPDL
jgi:hypothetical protein